ncbi:MAG: IS110 family transposase [Deltaproteobacteria bacterium]|nr:IS110 family transposase [Deltaproteobacteria bacterium]
MTLPGVGPILAVVIALEIGQVDRFPTAQKLACYGGTVPRIKESGGRIRFGKVRPDVNRYLKWALIEASNIVVLNQSCWPNRCCAILQAYHAAQGTCQGGRSSRPASG